MFIYKYINIYIYKTLLSIFSYTPLHHYIHSMYYHTYNTLFHRIYYYRKYVYSKVTETFEVISVDFSSMFIYIRVFNCYISKTSTGFCPVQRKLFLIFFFLLFSLEQVSLLSNITKLIN